MDRYFREVFEGLKQTADGIVKATEGIKRMAEAALHASNEHEDLRETVKRLETLVLAQGNELRLLRQQLEGRQD